MVNRDIFSFGRAGFNATVVLIMLIFVSSLFSSTLQKIMFITTLFAVGSLCLYNYRSCRRVHCQVTGYGLYGVGVLALFKLTGLFNLNWAFINIVLFMVLAAGYCKEFMHKKRRGSKYKKK